MALPTPALCPCQPSLPLILAMPLTCCVAQLLHPVQSIPAHPPMCFLIFSFFRILFLCDKCCRRCQNTYGERRRLLLQLLLLQSFKEGRLLGVLTKVLDIDTVFPSSVSDAKAIADAKAQYLLSNKAFWAAFDGLFASVCTGTW